MITGFDLYFPVQKLTSDGIQNVCNAFHPAYKLTEIQKSWFYLLCS